MERTIRYNRYDGPVSVADVFAASERAAAKNNTDSSQSSDGGSSFWNTIKNEINGWANTTFSGIRDIVAAKNPATVEDNTPKVLAIAGVGVAAVILIIVLVLVFKK